MTSIDDSVNAIPTAPILDPASEVLEAIDALIAKAPSVWEHNPAIVIEFLEELKEFAV